VRFLGAFGAAVVALGTLTRCSERDDGATPTPTPGADADIDATIDAGAVDSAVVCNEGGAQTSLECTGLYTDIRQKAVAPDVLAYAPAFPLWSDGATKSRWIYLPPGTQIDTTNMDEWRFPVGTKLWKEFVLGGRRIETRLIEKRPDGTWLRQTFQWSNDEGSATELSDGQRNVGGTTYEIPPQAACLVCHDGRIDGVLGFEAVGLGNDGATGLTLDELVRRKLITTPPTAPVTVPGNATERPALGWLHANCGIACHNASPNSRANFTYLYMRLDVGQLASVSGTDTYTTAVKKRSGFQFDAGAGLYRIEPGRPDRSIIPMRDSVRDDALVIQMPPLLTHVVDDAGVAAVDDWIRSLPP
jgi:hypothetical protein